MGLGARPVGAHDAAVGAPGGSPTEAGDRRLFIAVAVPDALRTALTSVLAGATARMRDGPSAGLRWVAPDGLHLTVRFLGATPADRVEAAADAVREAAAASGPFGVTLGACGAFPRDDAPRALWLSVDAGAAELASLARSLDAALLARGWPSDTRPLRAHLTVARSEQPAVGREALAGLRSALASAGPGVPRAWRAREVVLFESHLGRGPARYEIVTTATFGA